TLLAARQALNAGHCRWCFLRFLPRDRALSLLLNHHRLRPAVAELLLHVAGFDSPLQAERLARACQHGLIGGFFRFAHTLPVPNVLGRLSLAADSLLEADSPDRYRVTRPTSFRKFVVAPPALIAACTTFDRPKAKLICSTVNS